MAEHKEENCKRYQLSDDEMSDDGESCERKENKRRNLEKNGDALEAEIEEYLNSTMSGNDSYEDYISYSYSGSYCNSIPESAASGGSDEILAAFVEDHVVVLQSLQDSQALPGDQAAHPTHVPPEFRGLLDPISHRIMRHPVVLVDGHTYDRDTLSEAWGKRGYSYSPVTNQRVPSRMIRNIAMEDTLHDFRRLVTSGVVPLQGNYSKSELASDSSITGSVSGQPGNDTI